MKKFIFSLLFLSFSLQSLTPMRCCYPVAATIKGGQTCVFYLDQQSLQCLQLWEVNPHGCSDPNKALMFIYSPSSISLLPSQRGFGFIDRGRIKMKSFIKRSPHSLDFYEPIYNITRAQWIDDEHCYFSAKQDSRYKLFISDLEGELDVLVDTEGADIVYPSHVGDSIYYLSKDTKEGINLFRIDRNSNEVDCVMPLGRKNVAFLEMRSGTEGFFVQAPFSIDTEADNLELEYYRIYLDGEWKLEKLFSFTLPTHYLFGKGPERFYESLMAFLPKAHEDEILFSSLLDAYVDIFTYNRVSRRVLPILEDRVEFDRFGAMEYHGEIYYGRTVRGDTDYDEMPDFVSVESHK
ncbi:MAG TPA: hypothetical protein QGF02_00490 [Candidatus Babeliales bacterium]|nr:hypothetical protein [Candidatus Babeliales bacterium]